jgi:hypothetical protein
MSSRTNVPIDFPTVTYFQILNLLSTKVGLLRLLCVVHKMNSNLKREKRKTNVVSPEILTLIAENQ